MNCNVCPINGKCELQKIKPDLQGCISVINDESNNIEFMNELNSKLEKNNNIIIATLRTVDKIRKTLEIIENDSKRPGFKYIPKNDLEIETLLGRLTQQRIRRMP